MLLIWTIVTIGAVIIEIVTLGNLICIWFAVGGLAGIILAALKVSEMIQYIAFFVVSIISMLIIRPLAANYLRGNTVPTNSDRVIGQSAVLTQPITLTSWGELKIGGTAWSAVTTENKTIEAGKMVKILAIDGAKLIVKEID